jgi:large subunit ribosomal protein L6
VRLPLLSLCLRIWALTLSPLRHRLAELDALFRRGGGAVDELKEMAKALRALPVSAAKCSAPYSKGRGRMSRIGKKPVALVQGVSATISGQTIEVKGPKGTRSFTAGDDVQLTIENDAVKVTPRGMSKRARSQWGMSRSMIANLVVGVTAGFKKEMEIQGVGYRAAMVGKNLQLQLGFSHEVLFEVPEGVVVAAPKQTEISVEGIDQQLVGQVAANIRAWKKPEPYKGKGIRYKGEFVFRKEGKKK